MHTDFRLRVNNLGSSTRPLTNYELPRWAELVNENWLLPGKGEVFEAVLPVPDTARWVSLGVRLSGALTSLGNYVGTCVEGISSTAELALRWASNMVLSQGDCLRVADLHWSRQAWPPGDNSKGAVDTVCLCTLEASSEASWVNSFWADLDWEMLDYAADLVVAAYSRAPERTSWDDTDWRDRTWTRQDFARSLADSAGWIKPGDGWGFWVGASSSSALHEALQRLSQESPA